jgi:hypothetical protein
VVRDGRYGRPPGRQRYRCTGPGGTFHRFTPPLPRELAAGGVCTSCDTEVAAHAGPVVSRAYRHRLHLVAEALVAVGRGVSYARASQRARVAAGRDPLAGDGAGQLVAEWVDAWGPVILDKLTLPQSVETLVLDSTDFWWTNKRTGIRRREFAVLVAYGYRPGGGRHLLGVRACATARASDYLDLLNELRLPMPPRTVVADDDLAIAAAVRQAWPDARDAPVFFACEHHLRVRALAALKEDKAHAPAGRWGRRLDTAFRRPEGWAEFRDACAPLAAAARWVGMNDTFVSNQVAMRHQLPAHYSTAAAEAVAAKLRRLFEQRSFALRNARRTNILLGLTRLHLNNADDVATYHRILREHAEQRSGLPPEVQRRNRDQTLDPLTGKRLASLR